MPDCRFTNFDIAIHGQGIPDLVHAEIDPAARARSFVQRHAALATQREHVERLTAFLLANTPGSAAAT